MPECADDKGTMLEGGEGKSSDNRDPRLPGSMYAPGGTALLKLRIFWEGSRPRRVYDSNEEVSVEVRDGERV